MAMTEVSTTRLHITPLTPDILPSVLPASLRDSATDISFHTIPTFPENSYGYVTLPAMAADKIKKKLNGSILKGKKFKVEAARPHKKPRDEENEGEESGAVAEPKKKSKKRKSEDGLLDGYEMPSDRKVKRGWTESTSAKKERRKSEKRSKSSKEDRKEKTQPTSKYTEKEECLFRTSVPPNRASDAAAHEKKARRKKKSSQEAVVHEFEKTVSHPSFLRSVEDAGALTTTFEEGKGWVDTAGNMKEPSCGKIKMDGYRPGKVAGAKEKRGDGRTPALQESKAKSTKKATQVETSDESEDWTSSSGSSSDESSESDSESEDDSSSSDASSVSPPDDKGVEPPAAKESAKALDSSAAATSESEDDEKIREPAGEPNVSSTDVHPLEALFKRPAPGTAESQPAPEATTGFSFFGGDDIESEDDDDAPQNAAPHTPFTKQALLSRGLRSAAPTPDTALVSRHMKWADDDDMGADEEEDGSFDTPVARHLTMQAGATKEETEFAKWFWEHRGENNRAWKKRRRDAAKEQRQRDNRKKGLKGKS